MSRMIAVVSAGLGTPSSTRLLADRLTDAVRARVSARGEALEVVQIEVRELVTDLAAMMATGMASERLEQAYGVLNRADGVVALTPVFTASYSGLFKMFFDAMDKEFLVDTPVLLAATAGTARHSLVIEHAMRPMFAYLGADVVPTGVFVATDDFGGDNELGARIGRAAEQFASRVVAERAGVDGFTARPGRSDELRTPAGFASLLKGHSGLR